MSTPNINTNIPSRGIAGESVPAPVVAQKTSSAPVEMPKVAVKNTPSPEQLKNMIDKANQSINKSSSQLEFSVDKATDKTIIKVKEAQSGKLIMQFPSEEMLSVTRAIDRAQPGVLLKDKA